MPCALLIKLSHLIYLNIDNRKLIGLGDVRL